MVGSLRFLLSFRHEGVPGLRAGVLAGGAPRVYCLFGDRKWSCARRERWRVRGESSSPHPPVGARRGPEQAAPLWTSVSLQESWELMRLGSLTPADGGLLLCSYGRCVWLANGEDLDLFRGQMPSSGMSWFIKLIAVR